MLLIETNLNTNIVPLVEESSGGNKPLKFRGRFAKLDHKTENGRTYSRKLWENCLSSKSVIERLERRQMLGELKHPDYRDIDIEKSAFIITKLWIENGYVMGEAEIAPFPALGGILEVFLRAGCQIGISSRGEGSIVERHGDSFVDEKDFDLITFDSTLNPAVTEAIPEVVKENIQRGLDNLTEQYTQAQKIASKNLELLKENADLTELKRVITLTENSIHIEQKKKMETSDKNSFDNGKKVGKIVERYNQQLQKSIKLLKENEDLKIQLESSNLTINSLKHSNEKILNKSEELLESYEKLKDTLNQKEGLIEGKTNQQTIFKKDYVRLESKYNRSLELVETLLEKVEEYEAIVSDSESTLDSLKEEIQSLEEREQEFESENLSLKERTQREQPQKERLRKELKNLDEETNSLKKQLRISETKKQELELKFKENNKRNIQLEKQISELTNLLNEAKRTIVKYKKARVPSESSALSEDTNSQKSQIKNNVTSLNQGIQPRQTKITNQVRESFNESSDEDSMYAIMSKMN